MGTLVAPIQNKSTYFQFKSFRIKPNWYVACVLVIPKQDVTVKSVALYSFPKTSSSLNGFNEIYPTANTDTSQSSIKSKSTGLCQSDSPAGKKHRNYFTQRVISTHCSWEIPIIYNYSYMTMFHGIGRGFLGIDTESMLRMTRILGALFRCLCSGKKRDNKGRGVLCNSVGPCGE